jgi:peptidoglycan/LPS O-acetylase OafA/YrhL
MAHMKNQCADGLRGIAAFNVAVNHFVAAFLPMMLYKTHPSIFSENSNPSHLFEIITSPIFSVFYNGNFAVLIFFVLSGYVLTLPFFSNIGDSKNILEKRLWGRYLRLNIPIASAILISYFFYKLGMYSNVEAAQISGSVNWLKNFFPDGITFLETSKEAIYGSIFFGAGTLVPPLWTLKIEFIGSLYILIFYISKPKKYTAAPLLMVLFLIYAMHLQDSIFYLAFFAGSLLGNFQRFLKYRFFVFALGIYFGGFQFNSIAYDFLPNLNFLGVDIFERKNFYNALGAVFVTLSVIQGFGLKVFESRLFQFLGRISFSIYLIHFIVLCSLSSFVYVHLPQSKLFLGINFALYLVVCFFVSMIFERFVDKVAINISHKFSSKMFSS